MSTDLQHHPFFSSCTDPKSGVTSYILTDWRMDVALTPAAPLYELTA